MDRVTDWGCDVANQVPADVASRAAAVTTASHRCRNAGSAALAASRAGSTRRNSSMGLCWVRRHSTGSSRRNSARALRFQLHDRLAAMAASRLMRSGTAGPLGSGGVIALQAKRGRVGVGSRWTSLRARSSPLPPLPLRKEHPPQGKHNPLQKLAYSSIYALGALAVLTGLSIYKPTQLGWLTALFGGFQAARYWHFWTVWIFVAFTITHVVLVFVVDPPSLRAMITGWYRGRFPSHD